MIINYIILKSNETKHVTLFGQAIVYELFNYFLSRNFNSVTKNSKNSYDISDETRI